MKERGNEMLQDPDEEAWAALNPFSSAPRLLQGRSSKSRTSALTNVISRSAVPFRTSAPHEVGQPRTRGLDPVEQANRPIFAAKEVRISL